MPTDSLPRKLRRESQFDNRLALRYGSVGMVYKNPRPSPAPWKARLSAGPPRAERPYACNLSCYHSTHGGIVAFVLPKASLRDRVLHGFTRGPPAAGLAWADPRHAPKPQSLLQKTKTKKQPAAEGGIEMIPPERAASREALARAYICQPQSRFCQAQTWRQLVKLCDMRGRGWGG